MVYQGKYFYPDPDNTIISIYVENNEPYEGYWLESEKYALEGFEELLESKKYKKILDVGAGTGRLINQYKECFSEITIVEPDSVMLAKAKKRLKDKKGVCFINNTLLMAQLPSSSYDMILCSHTLQFITPYNLENFLEKIYKLLKPGGYLFLLTSHSRKKESYYIKTFIDYHRIKSKKISEKKFTSLRTNYETTLVQKLFSISELKELFSDFKLIEYKVFHILNNHKFLDKIIFRDRFYNMLPHKGCYGKDVYMLLKKPKKMFRKSS